MNTTNLQRQRNMQVAQATNQLNPQQIAYVARESCLKMAAWKSPSLILVNIRDGFHFRRYVNGVLFLNQVYHVNPRLAE